MASSAHHHNKRDWPLSQHSQYVHSGSLQWHVQMLGEGPVVCLLHGTGSSTHSWRALATSLSSCYRVVMCDLPGHGFSALPDNRKMSLVAMSDMIANLFAELDIKPDFLVGHSAGAAIACQMVLEKRLQPHCIVSINGALIPFAGIAGQLFSPLAQLMASNAMIPRLVRWRASDGDFTSRLLKDTGSVIDTEGGAYYKQLLTDKKHISGALKMMAHWNLQEFYRRLPSLNVPLHIVVSANDKTVPPKQGIELARRLDFSTLNKIPALGHLAHEEAPKLFDALLRKLLQTSSLSTTRLPRATEQ